MGTRKRYRILAVVLIGVIIGTFDVLELEVSNFEAGRNPRLNKPMMFIDTSRDMFVLCIPTTDPAVAKCYSKFHPAGNTNNPFLPWEAPGLVK